MTVQQKLDLFAKITFDRVARKRLEGTQEIQSAIKDAVIKAEELARHNMEDKLKTEEIRLKHESHKKIYEASMLARHKMSLLRQRLIDNLLINLEKELRDFVVADTYKSFLFEGINIATDDDFKDFALILLTTRDLKFKEDIESWSPFIVKEAKTDFIGGFQLISKNGQAVADYTLLARLGELNDDRGSLWYKWSSIDSS